jgi:hypothetical protein
MFVQTPLTQVLPAPHAKEVPQPPQLLLSVSSFTHAPLQSVYPLLHMKLQALLAHVAVALAIPVEHAVPQAPQLLGLLVASTHTPLQSVGVATGQPETQVDPEQTGVPPLHFVPQPPQLLVSLVSLTQAPPHSVYPLLHAMAHVPLTQTADARHALGSEDRAQDSRGGSPVGRHEPLGDRHDCGSSPQLAALQCRNRDAQPTRGDGQEDVVGAGDPAVHSFDAQLTRQLDTRQVELVLTIAHEQRCLLGASCL